MSRGVVIREVEEFPRRIKIFVTVILLLILVGVFGFKIIDKSSYGLSLIRTLQTLAFIFNEDSALFERLLEIFLAIIGVFLIWWVLWSVADMILDGNLKKYLKIRYYSVRMKSMKNHIIIVGGGRVGEEIAKVIFPKKHNFLIIEKDATVAKSLKKKGYLVLEADVENEKSLLDANIKYAGKIIFTLPKTETNIIGTLTAKELNPEIEVYARAEKTSLVSKLKRAGAKIVVIPELVAGDKLAKELNL